MISCDQFGAVGVDADGFSVVLQGYSGLVAYECAMSCECSVSGVREPHEVAGGAPVSTAVSRASGVALLLARQRPVALVLFSARFAVSVRWPEHLPVAVTSCLDDQFVMRHKREALWFAKTECIVRVRLGKVELVACVRC